MRVVIGGAGVAALEAAAALRGYAADRLSVTIVAPDPTFAFRALQPWSAFGVDPRDRVSVRTLAERLDAELVADRVGWVDRRRRTVGCRSGKTITFDALLLGVGATVRVRFPKALTLHEGAAAPLTELVSQITSGGVRSVAFVAPERMAWSLPLYETALMTAALGREHRLSLSLTLVTGETDPLQAFGTQVAAEMRALLDEHGIDLITSTRCRVPASDRIILLGAGARDTDKLRVDRTVALPELLGPGIRGVPSDPYGFIPIDQLCRVSGTTDIYAAGDGTDFPVKHGGIAAQQAEVAARCIAASAGADVQPRPFHPTLDGLLLTGGRPRYLTARLIGGHPFGSRIATAPIGTDEAPAKVLAPHLIALLEELA